MDERNDLPPNVSDHDLLIVLHTTMKHMARDVASIKDETIQRIAVVEATKYDKDDATKALADVQRTHDDLIRRIDAKHSKEDADKIEKTIRETLGDHEKRQRVVERNMYIAVGALAIIQLLIAFIK